MTRPLHALAPLGQDADGDDVVHAPILCMDLDVDVPRCDECGLPAGVPHRDVCPIGKRADGTPRYPEAWLVYYRCRGLNCCPTARCERSHLLRHRVEPVAVVPPRRKGRAA